MIPKIIHCCKYKKFTYPQSVDTVISSWKKHLPDYEIKIWDEDSFDINISTWTKECYESGYSSYPYINDYIKFWALYNYGGIYLDLNQTIVKSINPLLNNQLFIGAITNNNIGFGIIGAERGNKYIKEILDLYNTLSYINKNNILRKLPVQKIAAKYLPKFTIYTKEVLYADPNNMTKYTFSYNDFSDIYGKVVSVVMPAYNAEKYIKEAIDSVLNQTFKNFELIIVDDGSTDNTESIIKSYNDNRIVYIKKKHSGISETLNLGIKRASGVYIARMDTDDMMYKNRLERQVAFMQNNPQYDMVGCGFEWGNGKPEKEYWQWPDNAEVKMYHFENGNVIGHPTVMFRYSSLYNLPFLYEKLYDGCEDMKLWLTMLSHDKRIYMLKEVLHYYRQHPEQCVNTNTYKHEFDYTKAILRAYSKKNSDNAKLTVILPFQNENVEVEKTVTSIRATVTDDVNIILIDDNSNDNFDYKRVADIFGCDFYRNSINLGVAGSRDFGVSKCKTPYFVLLDAHMRFYELDWHKKVIAALEENDKRLITSNSIIIYKNDDGTYDNEEGIKGRHRFGTYGAVVNLYEEGWEFTSKWTGKMVDPEINKNKELIPCACVLGAFYATSVNWWNHIEGLNGLVKYGLDEPLMSIKTWLAGGECLIFKDWGVGHLYRSKANYHVPIYKMNYNQIYLIHIFAPEYKIDEYCNSLKKRIGDDSYNESYNILKDHYVEVMEFRKHFWDDIAVHDFEYFKKINDKVF